MRRPVLIAARCAPAVLALVGCRMFGLSEEEQNMLNIHKQNSKLFSERGDLDRAEDQCRRGLTIDPDDVSLRLTYAYVHLRRGTEESLQRAESILEDMTSWFGSDDFRVLLGLGSIHKQRARLAAGLNRSGLPGRDVRRAEAGTAGGSRRACNSAGEPPGPSASAQLPAFHRRLGSRFTCHRSPSRRRRCC